MSKKKKSKKPVKKSSRKPVKRTPKKKTSVAGGSTKPPETVGHDLKVGDTVVLNSGGSDMKVVTVAGNIIHTEWGDYDGNHRGVFTAAVLTKKESSREPGTHGLGGPGPVENDDLDDFEEEEEPIGEEPEEDEL